jgi:hypothetical protein
VAPEAGQRWLSPDVAWPGHRSPAIEEALAVARSAGWWYRKSTDHGQAIVFCRRAQPGEKCCFWPVWSTGRSPEGPARSLRRMVKVCKHRQLENNSALEEIQRLLEGAERILSAANSFLSEMQARGESDDYLDQALRLQDQVAARLEVAERSFGEIEELLKTAEYWDAQAEAFKEEAAGAAATLGQVDLEVTTLADLAQEQVNKAELMIDDLPRQEPSLSSLRNRIDGARGRMRLIRAEITGQTGEAPG